MKNKKFEGKQGKKDRPEINAVFLDSENIQIQFKITCFLFHNRGVHVFFQDEYKRQPKNQQS